MSEEMKEYLGQVTERHGFYTRMAVPCRCESRQLPAYQQFGNAFKDTFIIVILS